MKIGLHDSDKTDFPNLALMKLSAWHKQQGDEVEWFVPMFEYDRVYSSKVFSWTKEDPYLPPDTIKGGSGYGIFTELPNEIEHICPDYFLYGINYSLGYTTRGCIRRCKFCIVPRKEGEIRPHAELEEFVRHRDVVLLDNNILAHEHGIRQIEKAGKMNLRIDCTQGIDARLIDDDVAKVMSGTTWLKPVSLACDHSAMMKVIERAVNTLRRNNVTPKAYRCSVLCGDDIQDCLNRVEFLRGLGVDPFVMPFRDQDGNEPNKLAKDLSRYTFRKMLFKACTFEQYVYKKYNMELKDLI